MGLGDTYYNATLPRMLADLTEIYAADEHVDEADVAIKAAEWQALTQAWDEQEKDALASAAASAAGQEPKHKQREKKENVLELPPLPEGNWLVEDENGDRYKAHTQALAEYLDQDEEESLDALEQGQQEEDEYATDDEPEPDPHEQAVNAVKHAKYQEVLAAHEVLHEQAFQRRLGGLLGSSNGEEGQGQEHTQILQRAAQELLYMNGMVPERFASPLEKKKRKSLFRKPQWMKSIKRWGRSLGFAKLGLGKYVGYLMSLYKVSDQHCALLCCG